MINLGDFKAGATVDFKWNTNAASGASITRATNGSIRIYKNNSTTERSSANGITDTEDFDSLTGVHHLRIDLSDNTDAGFYAAGNEYDVVLQGAVIDGQTVNVCIAHFSIERALRLIDGITPEKLAEVVLAAVVNVAAPSGSTVAFKKRDGTTTTLTITYGTNDGERTGSTIA